MLVTSKQPKQPSFENLVVYQSLGNFSKTRFIKINRSFTKETSDSKMVLVWVYSQLTPIDTKCTKY